MDLSALLFVALAVAWAVYLVPKALKHHEDVVRSRSVDRFSHSMRVLARREPVDRPLRRRGSRLVVSPGRAPSPPVVTTKLRSSAFADPRETARVATRRRRRVLGGLLVALLVTVGLSASGLASWWWVAAPAGLLVAWLVACRLMVRHERNRRFDATIGRPDVPVAPEAVPQGAPETGDVAPADLEDTSQTPAIADPGLWDPMPVTLPTYVTAPVATRRTVRTIDLDSTGVWTSGRSEVDTLLAREAEESARLQRARVELHRATGS